MNERNKVRILRYGAGIITLIIAILSFDIASKIPELIPNSIFAQVVFVLALIFVGTFTLCFSLVAVSRCEIFLDNHYPKVKLKEAKNE